MLFLVTSRLKVVSQRRLNKFRYERIALQFPGVQLGFNCRLYGILSQGLLAGIRYWP